MRARVVCLVLVVAAACGKEEAEDAACEQRVQEARDCVMNFCAGKSGELCDCARAGMSAAGVPCACSRSLDETLREQVCDTESTFDCSGYKAQLGDLSAACSSGGCTGDFECDRGEICEAGSCGPGCREDIDCRIVDRDTICQAGTCVTGCREDIDCFEGELDRICDGSLCRDGCRRDLDCYDPGATRQKICESTRCVTGCRTSLDCASSEKCVGGMCEPI